LVHLNQNGITAEIESAWSAPTNVLADLPNWLTNLEFTGRTLSDSSRWGYRRQTFDWLLPAALTVAIRRPK
jgi:hypothetical protein